MSHLHLSFSAPLPLKKTQVQKTGKIQLLSPEIAARFEYLEERIQYGNPPFPGIVLEPQEAEERLKDTSEV